MKSGQRLWTKNELIIAINLYCKIPFGKIGKSNPKTIHLFREGYFFARIVYNGIAEETQAGLISYDRYFLIK